MSTEKDIWINGPLVRRRCYELGLSEREFGRRVAMTSTTVRSVVSRNRLSISYALSDLQRMVAMLGVTIADLLVEPPASAEAPEGDDCAVLLPLLGAEGRAHEAVRLAIALGWTLERLYAAAEEADKVLPDLGLRLHRTHGGLALKPFDERAEPARRRLATLRDDEEGILPNAARVLFAAHEQSLSGQEDKNDHMVQLGRLHNLGALTDRRADDGSRNSISDETAYCLDF